MTTLDPAVSAILDNHPHADSDDEDALLASLEDDDSNALSHLREQRLQQLHAELARERAVRNADPWSGQYTEIKDEKQILDITTSTKLCVVHFMKPDFTRCRIMDQRLEALAPRHFDTRFMSINVEGAPFLVAKLKIQVLPCVICFVDGVGVDRVIGFEGLGVKPDTFTLKDLEGRLLKAGVLTRAKVGDGELGGASRRRIDQEDGDESGEEWD